MYKIELLHEDERASETMDYIESKTNWDVKFQTYRLSEKEFEKANHAPLLHCHIYARGEFLIVQYKGIIHYWEHNSKSYLNDAIFYLDLEQSKKWTTLEKLISLRCAIRHDEINGKGFVELLLEGEIMNEQLYDVFMERLRMADYRHHGQHTF